MRQNETQLSAVKYALEHLPNAPESVLEKLTALSNSLAKKASAERKPTPKQVENAGFKADILEWMEPETLYSPSEVTKGVPAFAGNDDISNARVVAMLSQLKDAGQLVRVQVKGKVYFKLA